MTLEIIPTLLAVVYFIGIVQYYTNITSLFYMLELEDQLSTVKLWVGSILWPVVTIWTLVGAWVVTNTSEED